MFVSEAAYTEHSIAARWLHRAPTAAEQRARDGAAAALDEGTLAPSSEVEAPPDAGREAAGGGQCHSALSWEEHAWFLRHSAPDSAARLTPAEHKRLQMLGDTVAAEQAAYLRERVSGGADADALRFLHPDVAEQARGCAAPPRPRKLTLRAHVPCRWRRRWSVGAVSFARTRATMSCMVKSASTTHKWRRNCYISAS